jgi:hypothetical protein
MATTPYPFVSGAVLTASQLNSTFNVPVNAQTASYVLVASDAGKRVQMNAAGATTITVNTSLFSAGDSLFIQNIGAGTCTITAGTATVTTAGSLALAQWGGGTLYFTSASAAIFFSGGGTGYGTATGGSSSSITVGGVAYTLLTFTSDSNLVVSKAGLFDVLLVGGGGGGYGASSAYNYGGGGAGGVILSTVYFNAATLAVDVGAGGAAGVRGFDSTIGDITVGSTVCPIAVGGGNTRWAYDSGNTSLGVGGSGGGNSQELGALTNAVVGQGRNGGAGAGPNTSTAGGGGGGGAAAVGQAGNYPGGPGGATGFGGAGGAGLDISVWLGQALTTTYKAGGGGGRCSGATSGAGGIGGGGAGNSAGSGSGTAGTANSGGGGGAGFTGGAGGSGIVYVRFKS